MLATKVNSLSDLYQENKMFANAGPAKLIKTISESNTLFTKILVLDFSAVLFTKTRNKVRT